MKPILKDELFLGMRVKAKTQKWTGVVYDIGDRYNGATIKRDDGASGGGKGGYWAIDVNERGEWGENGGDGQLLREKEPTSYHRYACADCGKKRASKSGGLCKICDDKPI